MGVAIKHKVELSWPLHLVKPTFTLFHGARRARVQATKSWGNKVIASSKETKKEVIIWRSALMMWHLWDAFEYVSFFFFVQKLQIDFVCHARESSKCNLSPYPIKQGSWANCNHFTLWKLLVYAKPRFCPNSRWHTKFTLVLRPFPSQESSTNVQAIIASLLHVPEPKFEKNVRSDTPWKPSFILKFLF